MKTDRVYKMQYVLALKYRRVNSLHYEQGIRYSNVKELQSPNKDNLLNKITMSIFYISVYE